MSPNQKSSESTTTNTEPFFQKESEFAQSGKKLERLAQAGVKREIAKHKAAGQPIYYEHERLPDVIVMELPDGRRIEYHVDEEPPELICSTQEQ
jgi:hypothetical protein